MSLFLSGFRKNIHDKVIYVKYYSSVYVLKLGISNYYSVCCSTGFFFFFPCEDTNNLFVPITNGVIFLLKLFTYFETTRVLPPEGVTSTDWRESSVIRCDGPSCSQPLHLRRRLPVSHARCSFQRGDPLKLTGT